MWSRLLLTVSAVLGSAWLAAEPLSYSRDIQPIFTRNCVACHACYDAPCQLNLGSGEGTARGASQTLVYDGDRTKAQQPTQLYFDAQTTAGWRKLGFSSVLDGNQQQAALMARMLKLGHQAPLVANAKLPDDLDISIYRDNQCPLPDEFSQFAEDNPTVGMPFAVTGLTKAEYQTLQDWLAEGAPVDQPLVQASSAEAAQIAQWEALLNQPGARETLVGRWLFEHLFLAHLYFEGGEEGHFFQAVRSRTPSGEPLDIIATARPNDDPGVAMYYRIRPIQGVIVHKTHITYGLSNERLARVNQLFFGSDWSADSVAGYGPDQQANPFAAFAAIPAEARYQFMLDDAEYFVRTFIRGPVCRGQIATDVIRDQFWVLFQDPNHDLYLTDAKYRAQVTPLLSTPGQSEALNSLVDQWPDYRDQRNHFQVERQAAYAQAPAPNWDNIWQDKNDNALLTIFRHFDSAEVNKGLTGAVPETIWLLDFTLFERTYYQLVVNFDVFGTVSHQAQTRLFFDLIRNGAEENLLRLLPPASRQPLLDSWYQGASGEFKLWADYQPIDSQTPTALQLPAKQAWQEFAKQLLQRTAALNLTPDPINRCTGTACFRPGIAPELQDAEQSLSRLAARDAISLPVIDQMPEATLLRIEQSNGQRGIYSLLRNRAHSNVAFMFGESLRYEPELDTLTVYPGVLSSYPNFMFNVKSTEVVAFVQALEQVDEAAGFEKIAARWGIRRSNPQFWDYFHDLGAYIYETEPVEAGVLDMNRFENL